MNASTIFIEKIDSWIPSAMAKEAEQKLRARVIFSVMLICSGSVALVSLVLLVPALLGNKALWDGVFASLAVSLFWYGGIVFFRRTANLLWASHLFAFIMYSSTLGALLTSGGWSSPINSLLLAVPAGIFLVAGRRVGMIWSIISASTYYFLWLLHRNGFSLLQVVREEHREVLTVGIWCFSCFIMISCMTVYDRMAEVLKESLRSEREQYRYRMITDFLSGSLNRFGIESKFKELLQHNNNNILFLYFNIANLAAVNSELHYQAGDELIRRVAEVCRENLSTGTQVGRMTGGEFLLLVPAVPDRTGAEAVAQQLRQLLSQSISLLEGKKEVQVEGGIGVALSNAQSNAQDRDFRHLLRAAYEGMQESSRQQKAFVMAQGCKP